MTSKNSYWKNSKANLKRRMPYFVLSILVCFVIIPVVTYFAVLSYQFSVSTDLEFVLSQISREIATGGYLQDVLVVVLAVMLAITGNSWNNSQKKNDFYKSLPVKESTRFIYIHVNSLIIFVVSFGINLILANIIVACYGLYNKVFIIAALYSIFAHTLEFIAVYFVAVIAQYLTGNNVLAICGTFALGGVETVIRILIRLMKSVFYKTAADSIYDYTSFVYSSITSPVAGIASAHRSIGVRYNDYFIPANYTGIWPGILKTLVQIVIYVLIAYFIYNRRQAQAGNKNIIFAGTKPFIKCMIMIPAVMVWVLLILDNTNTNMGSALIGIIIALLILHIILQLVIEGDFGTVKKGILSTALAGLTVAIVMIVLNVNGAGFDRYKPAVDEVASIGVCTGNEYMYNFYGDDEFHSYYRSSDYFLNEVGITDKAFIEEVAGIIAKDIDNDTYIYDYRWDDGSDRTSIDIAFNLKSGKCVRRHYEIPLTDAERIEYLMYDQEEYRRASNQLEYETNKKYIEQAENMKVVYYNYGFSEFDICAVENKEMQKELLEALSKDHNSRSAEVVCKESPIGTTEITIPQSHGMVISFSMPMYANDVNSLEVYAKMDYTPHGLDKSEIAKIGIISYNSEYYGQEEIEITPEDEAFDVIADNIAFSEGYMINRSLRKEFSYDIILHGVNGNITRASFCSKEGVEAADKLFDSKNVNTIDTK